MKKERMKNERLMIVLTGAAGLLLLSACKPSTPPTPPPAATPPAASQPTAAAPATPPASQPVAAPPSAPPASAPAAASTPTVDGDRFVSDGVSWVLPEGWRLSDRQAQFVTHVFEYEPDPRFLIQVSRLRGTAGGPVMNYNRWRGQVGLTNLLEPQVNEQFGVIQDAGMPGMRFGDISTGEDGQRMPVAAWFGEPASWFFKMGQTCATGTLCPAPHADLEPHVAAFLEMARSVQVAP